MENKFSTIKDRVVYIVELKGLKKEKFFNDIGMTSANFRGNAKNTPLNSTAIENILSIFPDINADWLISGEGELYKPTISQNEKAYLSLHEGSVAYGSILSRQEISPATDHIPLIPVEAMAGYITGDNAQVLKHEITDLYHVPDFKQKGVQFLIRATGSSMYPKYSNGDLLACRPIKDLSFFQWGKVYVLDTDQGVLVKRVFPCENDDPDCIECRSDNKEHYPPFRISKASIRQISIVVGVIRLE